jgi:hypothetical protein
MALVVNNQGLRFYGKINSSYILGLYSPLKVSWGEMGLSFIKIRMVKFIILYFILQGFGSA